jgi:Co/Zn/Cd efflux system component
MTAHPATAEHRVAFAALWFGLFGAPVIWSIQLMLNYALVAHACYPASEPLSAPVFGGLRATVLAASAVALVIALAAGATAWRSWRATRQEHHRTRFMALAGMLVSGLFLLGVIMNSIPLFIMQPCG